MATELRHLMPESEQVKLSGDVVAEIQDLKLRQFLAMLRIITRGSLPMLVDGSFFSSAQDDPEDFAKRLLSVLVLSIPDAEDETVAFLQSLVKPAGLIEGRRLDKHDVERNTLLIAQLDAIMQNPELDDMVTILEVVIRREAADIQALGKRLARMFQVAVKAGSTSRPHQSTKTSSAPSVAVSTLSASSTAGTTNIVWTSPSSDSGNALRPSGNDGSTSNGETSNG